METKPGSIGTVAPRARKRPTPRYHETRARLGIHHPATTCQTHHTFDLRCRWVVGAPSLFVDGHTPCHSMPLNLSNIEHVLWSVTPHDVADTRCGNSPAPSPHSRDTTHVSWYYTFAYSFRCMPARRRFSEHGRHLYVPYSFDGSEWLPDSFRNVGVSKHVVGPRFFPDVVDSIGG